MATAGRWDDRRCAATVFTTERITSTRSAQVGTEVSTAGRGGEAPPASAFCRRAAATAAGKSAAAATASRGKSVSANPATGVAKIGRPAARYS